MAGTTVLPRYTKLDTNGKEVVYWVAKGSCGHITLFEIQSFKGDFIFCRRCNDFREVKQVKYTRPSNFIAEYGGTLVS
jgi:hypothetical protein